MKRNLYSRLILIVVLLALAIWGDSVNIVRVRNPFNRETIFSRDVTPRLGLDLRAHVVHDVANDQPFLGTGHSGREGEGHGGGVGAAGHGQQRAAVVILAGGAARQLAAQFDKRHQSLRPHARGNPHWRAAAGAETPYRCNGQAF